MAKGLLEARGEDAPVRVDAELSGKVWTVQKVYIPSTPTAWRRRVGEPPVLPLRVQQVRRRSNDARRPRDDVQTALTSLQDVSATATPESGGSPADPETEARGSSDGGGEAEAEGSSVDEQEVKALEKVDDDVPAGDASGVDPGSKNLEMEA